MVEEKEAEEALRIVDFLIPVSERGGKPYKREVYKQIQRELEERFGGWQIIGSEPSPGGWINPDTGEPEREPNWRYRVGITAARYDELDEYLSEVAARLGQHSIWRERYIGAEAGAIPAKCKNNSIYSFFA